MAAPKNLTPEGVEAVEDAQPENPPDFDSPVGEPVIRRFTGQEVRDGLTAQVEATRAAITEQVAVRDAANAKIKELRASLADDQRVLNATKPRKRRATGA